MKRSHFSHFTVGAVLALGVLAQGCSNDNGGSGTGGTTAAGGSSQAGQTANTSAAAGGSSSAGGASGGASSSSSTPAGGSSGGAGSTASPGSSAIGGSSKATGGSSTTGTTQATGGSSKAGGSTGTTASSAAGGSTPSGGSNTGGGVVGGTSALGGKTGGSSATGGTKTGGTTAAGGNTSTAPAGNEFWIAPDGKDTATGSKDDPLFSLCDDDLKVGACYKLCPSGGCTSGTIWVKDGTYKYGKVVQKIGSTKLGTANGPLNVFAEAGAKPVFDFTGQVIDKDNRGIQLQGDYWHIKGITVTKAGDTGIFVMGNHNTIEQCVTHHNNDAGLVIGVNSSRSGSGSNNLILNCDSYQNFDSATNGENADGFGLKENTGEGNVFRGCRAWDNADDGWDLYAWASPVTIENSWAINQGKSIGGKESDCNGFKLGGDDVKAQHILKNLYATGNGTGSYGSSGRGFTNNSNPASLSCSGCASWGNKASDTGVSGVGTTAPSGATAQKMIDAKRDAEGNLPAITSL